MERSSGGRASGSQSARKAAQKVAKVARAFSTSVRSTSMIRLAIMIIHKTASCKSAETLNEFGKRLRKQDNGNSPLAGMFESVFGFLDAASRNADVATLHPESFIKKTLQSYYRTIGAHLLFLNSKNAGKLLVAITNDEQDLHNAGRLENNGDFGWLLEFLSGHARLHIGKRVPAAYYLALAGLCINGRYASSSSQKLIAGKLVEGESSIRSMDESVLDAYHLVESKWMKVSKFREDRKFARRVQYGSEELPDVLDPLARSAARVIERFVHAYILKKKVGEDVAHEKARMSPTRPNGKAGGAGSGAGAHAALQYASIIENRVAKLEKDAAGTIIAVFDVGSREQKAFAINAIPDQEGVDVRNTLCQVVNEERNAGSELQYKEPSLAHEDEYFLLEAQVGMMASLCKNRSDAKSVVEEFYCGHGKGTNLLFELVKGTDCCHGLRIEAVRLLHELRVDVKYVANEGTASERTNEMAPWSGPNMNHVWPGHKDHVVESRVAPFHPFIQTFHDWVVSGTGFVKDVSKFCQEMMRIRNSQGWNGVNSSGREPFHKMHGEFVCTVLKTVHFLVLTNFYSRDEKEHVNQVQALLNEVLFPIVGTFKTIFDDDIDSDTDTLSRTQMIERVLKSALDITMEITGKYQENSVVAKFIKDYEVLYSTLFHKGLDTVDKSDKSKAFVGALLGITKKMKSGSKDYSGALIEHKKIFALTDPKYLERSFADELDQPRGNLDPELKRYLSSQPLTKQYKAVRAYLEKEIFDFGSRFEVLHKLKNEKEGEATQFTTRQDGSTVLARVKSSFKDIFLNYGRRAPPGVAMAAMNLMVRIFHQEKFFFDACETLHIMANPATIALHKEVLYHARNLRLIVNGNLMNNDIADKVMASLDKLCDKTVDKCDGESESSMQRLCVTERLPQLMIEMVCLQFDFKSAELEEIRKHDQDDDLEFGETEIITPIESMLIKAYSFLEHVSKYCIPVQEMLYSSVDRLMASENSRVAIVSAHLAQALIPTFTNPFFQARVRKYIPVLCGAMLRLYEQGKFVAEYLDLLKAMATPVDPNAETTIVTLNQAEIISYIMTNGTMSQELLTAVEKKGNSDSPSAAEKLFDSEMNTREPPPKGSKESINQNRQFIVSLVELLATCGQGNNVYIESISRGWIRAPDIIKALDAVIRTAGENKDDEDVLLDEKLQLPRFKAFITFFYHIYISDKCSKEITEPTPLISSPMVWSIMKQCQREIRNLFDIIGGADGKRPKEKSTWRKQKELVLNVCIPFLTRMLNAHFTKRALQQMKDEDDNGEDEFDIDAGVNDKRTKAESVWTEEIGGGKVTTQELQQDFNVLAKDLMCDIRNVLLPTDRDRWNTSYRPLHGQNVRNLFEALANTIQVDFGEVFRRDGNGSEWDLKAKQSLYGLTKFEKDGEMMDTYEAVTKRKTKAYKTMEIAIQTGGGQGKGISVMLKENPKFDETIVIKKSNETLPFALKKGDDGKLTFDEHVNNHFDRYIQRVQDLDALQVRNEHDCHKPRPESHSHDARHPECQYLNARSEGGLPCSSQFFELTDVFRIALESEKRLRDARSDGREKNVIFKHIENLTFALTDRSLTDKKRLFLQSIIVTMLRVVASLLASHRCKDMGSHLPVNDVVRQAHRVELQHTQMALSASGGLSVAMNLFQQDAELLMKTAFMVFVSLQENSPDEVQDAVYIAVRADSAGPAFLRIQEELHRTLAVVSDNIALAEARAKWLKDAAQHEDSGSRRSWSRRSVAVSSFGSTAGDDAATNVGDFVAAHFGSYFDDDNEEADEKRRHSNPAAGASEREEEEDEEKSLLAKDTELDDGLASGDAVWCRQICNGLGKMVEGGHTELKLALRAVEGVNFVTELCAALQILPFNVGESGAARSSWLLLLQQIFYSLSEMCQGVPVNRQDAYDANLIKAVARVLELSVRSERVEVVRAQYQAISILHVMIENHDTDTKVFAAKIIDQLPPHVLRRTINIDYLLYKFEDETKGAPNGIFMESAFRCYFIIRKLSDLTGYNLEDATVPVWTPESQHHEFHAIAGRKQRTDADSDDDEHDDDDDREHRDDRVTRQKKRSQKVLRQFFIKTDEKVESKVDKANRIVQETDKKIFGRAGELQTMKKASKQEVKKRRINQQIKSESSSSPHQYRASVVSQTSLLSTTSRKSRSPGSMRAAIGGSRRSAAKYSTIHEDSTELQDFSKGDLSSLRLGAALADPTLEEVLEDDYEMFFNRFLDWQNPTSGGVPDRAIFFRAQTASIEFLRSKRLQKLYFRVPEDINVRLSQTFRNRILNDLSCDNAQKKVRDFLIVFPIIRRHLRRQQWLSNYRVLRLVTDGTAPYWRLLSLILTYVLCLMMLVAFQVDPRLDAIAQENNTHFPLVEGNQWYQRMLWVFGGMHVLISVGVCAEYFVNNSATLSSLSVGGVVYYSLFFGCSVAGLLVKGYFFGFHLLHVIQDNEVLNKAVTAVTHNGWVLWHILFLIMKIIFIFSIFSFLWLRSDFIDADGMHCNSLRDCFATQLSNSLVQGGGMREVLPYDTYVTDNTTTFTRHLTGRLFNDVVFWVVVNVITMSLVLGVIVDTFGQLRQDRKAKEDDLASKCFICSLDSYNFLNVEGQFHRHIKKDHNMWDYVYFTMYLENTTVAQRNHHEIYLFQELMEKQSIKPFPLLRAMTLKQDVDEKDVALTKLAETCAELRERTEYIAQRMEHLHLEHLSNSTGVAEKSPGQQNSVIGRTEPVSGIDNGGEGEGAEVSEEEEEEEEDDLNI